jgi:hypothetical protein
MSLLVPEVGTKVRVYSVRMSTEVGAYLKGTVASVDVVSGTAEVDLGFGTSPLTTKIDRLQFFPPIGTSIKLQGFKTYGLTGARGVVRAVHDAGSDWSCDIALHNQHKGGGGTAMETTTNSNLAMLPDAVVQATPDHLLSLPLPGTLVVITRNGSPGVVTSCNDSKFTVSVRMDDGSFVTAPPEELELSLVRPPLFLSLSFS